MTRRTRVTTLLAMTGVTAVGLIGAFGSSAPESAPHHITSPLIENLNRDAALPSAAREASAIPQVIESETNKAALVRLEPSELDLGPTMKGAERHAALRLINESSEPVRILSVSTDCGCVTLTEAPPDAVLPGESLEIAMRFQAPGGAGRVRRSEIVIRTNVSEALRGAIISRIVEAVAVIEETVQSPIHMKSSAIVRALDGAAFRIIGSDPSLDGVVSVDAALEHRVELSPESWRRAGEPAAIALHTDHPAAQSVVLRLENPNSTNPLTSESH